MATPSRIQTASFKAKRVSIASLIKAAIVAAIVGVDPPVRGRRQGGRPQRDQGSDTMRRHLAPHNPRNIANLEESLRILSRFEMGSEAANTNAVQSSVR